MASNEAARLWVTVGGNVSQAQSALSGLDSTVNAAANSLNRQTGGMATGLGRLNQAAGIASGGLGALAAVAGTGALVGLAGQAASAAMELGGLAAQVSRQQGYFDTWSGSAAAATENLIALRAAVDGAASTTDLLTSGSRFLSMGLATNATDLARFTEMAVLLGGETRTAGQALEEFALLLANQSILRLDTFGISGARVRARMEELQASVTGLSREQAFLNAVMEIGGAKVAALRAAGVTAGSELDKFKAATADLRLELGKLVEKPYTVVIEQVTKVVTGATEYIRNAPERQAEMAVRTAQIVRPEYELWQQATLAVAEAETQLAVALADGYATAIANAQQRYALAQANLAAAAAALELKSADEQVADVMLRVAQGYYDATYATGDWAARLAAAQQAAAAAAAATSGAASEAEQLSTALTGLRDKDQAARVNAVAMGVLEGKISEARVALIGLNAAYQELQNLGPNPLADLDSALAGLQQQAYDNQIDLLARAINEGKLNRTQVIGLGVERAAQVAQAMYAAADMQEEAFRLANRNVATDYRARMENEVERLAGSIESTLKRGSEFSINLLDLRGGSGGDPFAPGANGPFESIYRLQAWINDGSWAEEAQRLGITSKEAAAKVVADFQNGLFSPDVIQAIDTEQLVKLLQVEQAAEASYKAFASALASQAGTNTAAVDALLGVKDTKTLSSAAGKLAADFGSEFAGQRTSFETAGRGLVEGVAAGAASAKLGAMQTVTEIAQALVQAMREALEMRSPSRVFGAIGYNAISSISGGFVAGTPATVAALRRAAGQLTAAGAVRPAVDPRPAVRGLEQLFRATERVPTLRLPAPAFDVRPVLIGLQTVAQAAQRLARWPTPTVDVAPTLAGLRAVTQAASRLPQRATITPRVDADAAFIGLRAVQRMAGNLTLAVKPQVELAGGATMRALAAQAAGTGGPTAATWLPAAGRGTGSATVRTQMVHVQGDTYHMAVYDQVNAALTAALIAENRNSRLNQAMGVL